MSKRNPPNPEPSNTTNASSPSTAGEALARANAEATTPKQAAPATDALPNTEARAMGGNPANPDVNVLANTTDEGLKPRHANAVAVVTEGEAAAASMQAQDALQIYENGLALLKKDNEALREENRKGVELVRAWHGALGIDPGEDVGARVTEILAEGEALRERVGVLQIALGIGDGDDPERAAGALKARNRLADVDPTSHLPAYGHLLLMTALAKVSPLLRGFYNGVPNEVKTEDGDVWISRVEETIDADGAPIRNVVVRHEPGAYGFQEARARRQRLESDLADALRVRGTADRRQAAQGASRDAGVRDRARREVEHAARRIREVEAALAEIGPMTVEPEPREWRFNADLEGYALKGDA